MSRTPKQRTGSRRKWIQVREALRSNLSAWLPSLLPVWGCHPAAANLRLTHRCLARCRTCTHWQDQGDRHPELDTQTWKDILLQLRDHDVLNVSFTGGDILLREDTPALMAYAKSLDLRARATLNGYSITEETAREIMAACPEDLCLSLDHFDGFFSHTRGVTDASKKVLQSLQLLQTYNQGYTRLGLAVTLMKGSLEGSDRVIRFAMENNLFISFNLMHFTHYFTDTSFAREQYHLSDKELSDLKQLVNRMVCWRRTHPTLFPPPAHLHWIVSYFKDYRQPGTPCLKTMLKPCIDPDGSVRPCCSMAPVGNITQSSLRTIVRSQSYVETVRLGLLKGCPGCSCHFSLNLGANLNVRLWSYLRKREPMKA